jgi:hypothetical protein
MSLMGQIQTTQHVRVGGSLFFSKAAVAAGSNANPSFGSLTRGGPIE